MYYMHSFLHDRFTCTDNEIATHKFRPTPVKSKLFPQYICQKRSNHGLKFRSSTAAAPWSTLTDPKLKILIYLKVAMCE